MFQYAYYCKQIYFQQEQSKLSGEIAFFSNLKKRGFQSGLIILIVLKNLPQIYVIKPFIGCNYRVIFITHHYFFIFKSFNRNVTKPNWGTVMFVSNRPSALLTGDNSRIRSPFKSTCSIFSTPQFQITSRITSWEEVL